MPKYMGFEAYVTDEKGEPLPEYKVEKFNKEKMTTCYIPSNVNQAKSTIGLKKTIEWTYKVYVDGANVGARFCGPKDYAKFDAVIVSQDTSRPLVFGNLKMTDDDNQVCNVENKLDKLGTVQVTFSRFCRSGTSGSVEDNSRSVKTQVIHERSKKAGCHQVVYVEPLSMRQRLTTLTLQSLGDPISKVSKPIVNGTYLDLDSSPQFTFLFNYRSLDVLQAQDIAPRPKVVPPRKETNPDHQSNPTVGSSQGKRPADKGTETARKKQRVKREDPDMLSQREEVANMRKQLEELQRKLREAEESLADPDDGIKREASPISVPSFKRGKRIIVDLTSD